MNLQHLFDVVPMIKRSNVEVTDLRRGYVKCRLPLEGNSNHFNAMYAGSLFLLAEVTGGLLFGSTFDTKRFLPLVYDMKITYHKPARSAVTVEVLLSEEKIDQVRKEAAEKGRANFDYECKLYDESGVLVATTHNWYSLRPIAKFISRL
eukprot:c46528_g1_i1.p1 GENE.c46528_g1_i1~~c46528_g1_i1.p1  ORF type:complete len:158 (+),score=35.29 c46528_g1_i1:30-476(+)